MDVGPASSVGHHLRMATFPPAVFLHQAKVDIEKLIFTGCIVENGKLVRFGGREPHGVDQLLHTLKTSHNAFQFMARHGFRNFSLHS
jgi:hypothetical protein